ncbi:MAG: AMP-binding protein [Smithellaceae bacterium]|jgi:amino acid adenylation domain-containing protein|nr:AMP-binding protein [Syntrophaceae bacterium]
MPIILDNFRRIVLKYPTQTAVLHCRSKGKYSKISFAELDRRSDVIAGYLTDQGIESGNFVGVYMSRSIDHVTSILGIMKAGAAFYSLNPRTTQEQVIYTARLSRAPVVLIDDSALLNLQDIYNHKENSFNLTHYSSDVTSLFHEQIIARINEKFPLSRLPQVFLPKDNIPIREAIVPRDVALALFTSGSTGTPKGVLISHQDLYNRTLTECEYYGITRSDVLLNLLPFSFDVGTNQLFTALVTGAQLTILNSWMPADIVSTVKQHQITGISGVPAIWASFLNLSDSKESLEAIKSVRYITISGGDLAPEQLKRLGMLLQGTQIFKTYGQSETFRSGILLPSEYHLKMLSVGRPVKGTKISILNSKGKLAAPNEMGEIIHYGDGMMLGYIGDARGTARKIRTNPHQNKRSPYIQKAVFTGDIGKIDEDGYLYVQGRKDKMIKSSGYRIYPKEISDQILRHTSIQDAVVFGIPDKNIGKAIYAEVQLKENQELTVSELKTFLSDKLPPYMIPSKIFFVNSFPRTPSGKIRLAEVERKYHE